MKISDISVRRPVFASVISLLLVIAGVLAVVQLPVREYPAVDPPVISIDTTYRGASADVVERRITQVIEDEISGIAGITKMTSSSEDERSRIVIEFSLNRDADGAANDVRERVSRILGRLPDEAGSPQVIKQDVGSQAQMYVNVASETRSVMELTDFAERMLIDRLSVIDGVATVRVGGARRLSMRIWLDPDAMAARGLTVQDIEDTIRRENVEIPAGRIESVAREFTLRTQTALATPEDFAALVVGRGADNRLVRLGEVAQVRMEPEDTRFFSRSNRVSGIAMPVTPQSQANILAVNQAVRAEVERLQDMIPQDIDVRVSIDFSIFIRESMAEVVKVLGLALLIVVIVIFVFVGSLRATLVPALTIPVAIIASFIVMAALGYSINTLTLLGLVLAIGLVVDDAIIVLENIVRRMENGQAPLLAAIDGSREIGFAVIATTIVLISVFIPLSFMPGNLGRLFGEFGISLAAAVAFSSLVALTLVPMMTSKLFAGGIRRGRLTGLMDRAIKAISEYYKGMLRSIVRQPWVAAILMLVVGGSAWGFFSVLPSEYAPPEDRGLVIVAVRAPEGATTAYTNRQVQRVEDIVMRYVDRGEVMRVETRSGMQGGGDVNTASLFNPLVPFRERERTAQQVAADLRRDLAGVTGAIINVFTPPSLGIRGAGMPVQVVLGGSSYEELAEWERRITARVERENPRILGLRSDFFETKPKIDVIVDRDRAADLGVSQATIGRSLETMLGSRVVTTFIERGEEYNVLLQADADVRASPAELQNIFVRSERSGALIPLGNLILLEETAGPRQLNRFDRLRSITLSASLAPGYSLGEALRYLEDLIAEEIPEGVRIAFDGESRQFKEAGNAIYFTFALALLVCFLALSAQFESFRHPLIIMLTVPMALSGGLLGLWLLGSSINVFSQIGAIMLIGLAAKNGILIVEFANQLRDRGVEFTEAIVSAAAIRLRPVVMTSLCTAFGAIPLLLASGAGAESRQSLGAVVFFGVLVSMFLTLFLVPSLYALMARRTRSPEYITRMVEELKKREAPGMAGAPVTAVD
ncbi:MAG: efflux RND transporter permease subunit [Chromatiales bacterium]|nr:efflux RND transporter permease subunit [Chromatiales bacterium]